VNKPQGRRIVVNGKLLTYKQTAQFEKFMQDEDFRARFSRLAAEAK
jgi:hypothetical protein